MQGTKSLRTQGVSVLGLILSCALTLGAASAAAQATSVSVDEVVALVAQGDSHSDVRNYPAALETYRAAALLAPDSAAVNRRLEWAQSREAARQRFLLTVPSEAQAREHHVGRLYTEGRSFLDEGNVRAAHQRFEEVAHIDPTHRRVQHYLDRTGRSLDARRTAPGGAEDTNLPNTQPGGADSSPDLGSVDALLVQGQEALDRGDHATAVEVLAEARLTDPFSAEAEQAHRDAVAAHDAWRRAQAAQALTAGRQALEQADYGTAQRAAEELLQLDQREGARLLAQIDQANAQQSRDANEAAQEELAARIESLLEQADDLRDEGNYEEALQTAREVYALDVDSADAQRLIAGIQRDQQEAEQRAHQEHMEQINDLERAATRAVRRERYEEAVDLANQLMAVDPQNAAAQAVLSQAQQGLEATQQEAQEAAAQAQREEQAREDLYDRANALRDAGEYNQALEAASEAQTLQPDSRRYARLVNRISGEIAAQQASQARAMQEEAAEVADLVESANRSLARGRHDQAVELAQEALAIDGGNAEAQAVIAAVEEAQAAEALAREQAEQAEARAEELAQQAAQQEAAEAQAAQAREQEARELYDLARSQRDAGDLTAALESATQAAALDPTNRRYSRLAEAITEDVTAAQAQAQQAEVQEQAEQAEARAEELAQQAAQQEAAEAQAAQAREQEARELYDLARSQRDAGDLTAALESATQAAALDPTNRRYSRLAEAITEDVTAAQTRAQREEQEAQARAQEADADAQARAQQAEAEEQARAQEAELATERQRAENLADAIRSGQRALDRSRHQEAIEQFTAALALDQSSEAAQAGLAQAQAELEEIAAAQEAEQQIEQLLAQAAAQLEAGEFDAAGTAYEQALALDPDNRSARRGLEDVAEARERAEALAAEQARLAQETYEREQRAQSEDLTRQAQDLLRAGDVDAADSAFQEALSAWPDNSDAQRGLERVAEAREEMQVAEERRISREQEALVADLIQEGRNAYAQGDVVTAVERWNQVLAIDANNDYALTYLENTAEEYAEASQRIETEERRVAVQQQMSERLSTPITISTPPEGTPLQVFLNNIAVFTDLDFVIADGLEVNVTASFVEQPLRQVLDTVITANGLRYAVEDTVITIESNLRSRLLHLSPQDTASLKVFEESGMLDLMLYPPNGERPVQGMNYDLDDITGTFFVTGSDAQIRRVEELVEGLGDVSPFEQDTAFFTVREDQGQRIKQLIEAILEAEATPSANAFDRRIILQGENLIVRATQSEIRRVEQLLAEIDEIQGPEELEVGTWSLIPRQVIFQEDEETARQLAQSIVETVEVLLYSQQGAEAARVQGRRLWYDTSTMQLTLTDTPDNIIRITRYISSIPVLEPKRTTRIRHLDHQTAASIASKLGDFLDIEIRGTGGGAQDAGAGGDSVTRTLREDDEFVFRDIRVTLLNVEENDIDDDRDESVEMIIDTPTSSEERTIDELRSEIVDQYRIRVVDADAQGTGKAEIEITFLGAGAAQGGFGGGEQQFQAVPTGQTGGGADDGAAVEEEQGPADDRIPQVIPDQDTNSLLISVVNPGDLALIEEAIDLLDIPILQAQIETKFVEVNENRARELKNELELVGIGREGINFDDSFFGARYAQDGDEFRNLFEPNLESPVTANLPKGTTVLSLITGGSSPLQWEMAFLEAEGVINTVNGPFIVAQNNQSADFTITQEFRPFGPLVGVNSNNQNDDNNNDNNDNVETGTPLGFSQGAAINDIEMVDLEVTPTISQSGFITLEVDATILNFTNNLGQLFTSGVAGVGDPGTAAVINAFGVFSGNRKEVDTIARVRDGGTLVLGGWTLERVMQTSSGVPVLRNLPYVGQMFFSRNQDLLERLTLLIFLTARIIDIE